MKIAGSHGWFCVLLLPPDWNIVYSSQCVHSPPTLGFWTIVWTKIFETTQHAEFLIQGSLYQSKQGALCIKEIPICVIDSLLIPTKTSNLMIPVVPLWKRVPSQQVTLKSDCNWKTIFSLWGVAHVFRCELVVFDSCCSKCSSPIFRQHHANTQSTQQKQHVWHWSSMCFVRLVRENNSYVCSILQQPLLQNKHWISSRGISLRIRKIRYLLLVKKKSIHLFYCVFKVVQRPHATLAACCISSLHICLR